MVARVNIWATSTKTKPTNAPTTAKASQSAHTTNQPTKPTTAMALAVRLETPWSARSQNKNIQVLDSKHIIE